MTTVKYVVLNCDNTVECDTLEAACKEAEDWFNENWSVKLDPADSLDAINGQLRRAYGQGGSPDAACPEITEVEADGGKG